VGRVTTPGRRTARDLECGHSRGQPAQVMTRSVHQQRASRPCPDGTCGHYPAPWFWASWKQRQRTQPCKGIDGRGTGRNGGTHEHTSQRETRTKSRRSCRRRCLRRCDSAIGARPGRRRRTGRQHDWRLLRAWHLGGEGHHRGPRRTSGRVRPRRQPRRTAVAGALRA